MRYVVICVAEAPTLEAARLRARELLSGADCMVQPELKGATERLRAAFHVDAPSSSEVSAETE